MAKMNATVAVKIKLVGYGVIAGLVGLGFSCGVLTVLVIDQMVNNCAKVFG